MTQQRHAINLYKGKSQLGYMESHESHMGEVLSFTGL